MGALVPACFYEIPKDPYNGRALRFRRVTDGVAVYCVGPDRNDNQGNLFRARSLPPDGVEVGFQLWDAAKRRRAPGGGGP